MSVHVSTLPNGLRVVTDHVPHVETVTLGVWVDVGAIDETPEINGISHVLEHMAFKGTQRRNAQEIAEEIERVGGYLNAYTSREVTAYHARILKEDVALATDILADILQNSIFDAKEFEKERTVIIQEIGQSLDTPDDIVFDYFQATAFPHQSWGRPILGTETVLTALTAQQVKAYMTQQYGAQKMVLAAAGKVDHESFVALAEQKFSTLPQSAVTSRPVAAYAGGSHQEERTLEQLHVLMGFKGVPHNHPDYYGAALLSAILGGGMSSRLFQNIRERQGLVYSIYSYSSSYRNTGLFGIYAGTGPHYIRDLLPAVCEELRKITSTVEEEELKRAKAQLKAGLMMALESTTTRCEQLAHQMLIYGKPLPPKTILHRVDSIQCVDVMRIAHTVFGQPLTFTTLGPQKTVPSYEQVEAWLS